LSDDLVLGMGTELAVLHHYFHAAFTGSEIQGSALLHVLAALGIPIQTHPEASRVIADIKSSCVRDFKSFLSLLDSVRSDFEEHDLQINEAVARWSAIQDQHLAIELIARVLEDAGTTIPPDSSEHRIALHLATRKTDMYGSGQYAQAEARKVCMTVREHIKRLELRKEILMGQTFGFTEKQVFAFRYMFDELDTDHNGALDEKEVVHVLKSMDYTLSDEADLITLFKSLDSDGSGLLDFPEFLHMMKAVRDRSTRHSVVADCFVTTLQTMRRTDLLLLLSCFRVPRESRADAEVYQLVRLAADLLEVEPDTPLEEALGTKTVRELFHLARKRFQVRSGQG